MTKEVYVLNPKAWHMKLMTWMWGLNQHDFSHMCNYFWLSVLNVVILIPYVVIRLIGYIFNLIRRALGSGWELYENYCTRKEEEWLNAAIERAKKEYKEGKYDLVRQLADKFARDYKSKKQIVSRKDIKLYDHLIRWNGHDDFYSYNYSKFYEIRGNKIESLEKIKESKKTTESIERKKKVAKMAIYAKSILQFIAIFVGLFLLYLLYRFVVFLTTVNWGQVFYYSAFTILVIIAVAAAIFLLYALFQSARFIVCKYGSYCIPCERRREKVSKFFRTTGKVLSYPFVKFGNGVILLVDIIIELKKNHCPAIEWKDDD